MSYYPSYGIWSHAPVFLEREHPGRARCKHCGATIRDEPRLGWHGRFYHIRCWWRHGHGCEFTDILLNHVLSDEQLTQLGIRIEEVIAAPPIPADFNIVTDLLPGDILRWIRPPNDRYRNTESTFIRYTGPVGRGMERTVIVLASDGQEQSGWFLQRHEFVRRPDTTAAPEPEPEISPVQTQESLVAGARIRILVDRVAGARVSVGDILTVIGDRSSVSSEISARTEDGTNWNFRKDRLGTGFEIVEPVRPAQTRDNIVVGARIRFLANVSSGHISEGDERIITELRGGMFTVEGSSFQFSNNRVRDLSVEILEVPQ